MKVDVENISPTARKVAIEVPWDIVRDELEQAYRGLSKHARVKGFRPGHVPRKVLEQYYKRNVEGEVTHRLIDETFKKAIEDQSLVPVSRPTVSETPKIEKDMPFRFTATVEIKPKVIVKEYKGISMTQKTQAVRDSDIEKELATLQEQAAIHEPIIDREVLQMGDVAVIDFSGTLHGQPFKGSTGINCTLEIGKGQMIPGFEDALVGLSIGTEKTFPLQFPENRGPDKIRGKQIDWKVTLKR